MIEVASRRTYRCREATCGAEYRVKMLACHRCGGRDIEEVSVPKISLHGGATHEAAGVMPEAVDELAGAQRIGPQQPDEPADESYSIGEDGPEYAIPLDYGSWSKAQLQEECDLRELPRSGTIPQLVERLKAYDAEHAANPDEAPEEVEPE